MKRGLLVASNKGKQKPEEDPKHPKHISWGKVIGYRLIAAT